MPVDRVELRAVTCAANITQANAVETDLSFPAGSVVGIEIVVPDGHAGLTGLALARAHGVEIPASGTIWIIANDEVIHWPYEDDLNNGSWSAFAYNLDVVNAHTWYIRFLVQENVLSAPPPAPLLPASAIVQAGVEQLAAQGVV